MAIRYCVCGFTSDFRSKCSAMEFVSAKKLFESQVFTEDYLMVRSRVRFIAQVYENVKLLFLRVLFFQRIYSNSNYI